MRRRPPVLLCVASALWLAGCGHAPVTGASLGACADLPQRLQWPRTEIASATLVPAGTLKVGGHAVAEHCLVSGSMNRRTSEVDGQVYAIGFQMRLPAAWNGRFFYQANGGMDGLVPDAVGPVGGAGASTHALDQGFAVLSSDAGHNAKQNPLFGRDPQARLDYGYNAVAQLTPMAKELLRVAYGKPPARSYIGGCSNGGRHAMVAAARFPALYDGYLAGDPGFNLPRAAAAQLYGAQQYARIAGREADLGNAFTPAERQLVARKLLERCDALDGAADGLVQDTTACQRAFSLERDVPTCSGARDGSCLTAGQKAAIDAVFRGARDSAGQALYASFPYDAGISGANWAEWKFRSSVTNRDPVAMAYVFQTPPASGPEALQDPKAFALGFPIDRALQYINATQPPYAESSLSFMTPPHPQDLSALKARGGKMLVYHGTSDPVFSSDDTTAWYEALDRAGNGHAQSFVRFFRVPGMNHCAGGPSTDRFDMLQALVRWVEQGEAPEQVIAGVRGPDALPPNPELPAGWSAERTRPLCPYPRVARYRGTGDIEKAESFSCQ